MVNCWFGARWFGFLGSPYERDYYLGVPLESQTTNPNQQLTIRWAFDFFETECVMISCHSLNSFLDGKGQPTVTTKKSEPQDLGQEQLNHPPIQGKFLGRVGGSEFWVGWICTLPKTNMAPEDRPSQKETSIPTYSNHHQPSIFRCFCCSFQGG